MSSRVMLPMVFSVTSAVIGESSPYISRSHSCVATPVRFRLRFLSGAAIAAFSRWMRSAGKAGLVRMSSQILSPSSTCRMWIESEVGDTLPARNSIRSLIWSAVIDVVPPDRMTEPQRFCSPSLSAGSRNERGPPPPPPPGR